MNESPTNSMGGVYSLNKPGRRLDRPQDAERFYPDIDGNFTDGIPGNPGDPFYLRPEGYWDGGKNWSEVLRPDASQEFLIDDPTGKSTDGVITENGTVKTLLPPNSRHFILGPLVDGYVFNHGYDNYSNIGYIQKDTRQFVLLARIQGQFIEGLHPQGGRVWDGTAEQLAIYNSNFTLAMAEWFRDQLTANTFTKNVPYFYSGGVPQQPQTPAECPNCPPNMFGGAGPGTGPEVGLGAGGGPPSLGDPHVNGPSKSGGPDAAGAPFPGANPADSNNPSGGPDDPGQPPKDGDEGKTDEKPKGSLLAGFASIDSSMTSQYGMDAFGLLAGGIALIFGLLYQAAQAVLGTLLADFMWTDAEITALQNYANSSASQRANVLQAELANDEWEKQAQAGREADAQAAREANERLRDADEANDNATTPEEKARTQEALDNAIKNKNRVNNNNAVNNRQRAKERRERGLAGQPGIQGGAEVGMYNSYAPTIKSVQKLISEQEAVQNNGFGGSSGSSDTGSDTGTDSDFAGGGRVEVTTNLNPTVIWFKGQNVHFVGGFVGQRASEGSESINNMFKGTNISSSRVMNLYQTKIDLTKTRDAAQKTASDSYFNSTRPGVNRALNRIEYLMSLPFTEARGRSVDGLLASIDLFWDQQERLETRVMNLTMKVSYANKALGTYAMSGRLLTQQERDPFSIDDPTVGAEKNAKDKDKQIANLIKELEQEADEYKQAAAMARLKALGWGALMTGAVVLGAIVLAKPAIVGAIGLGTVRLLKTFIKSKPPIRPTPITYPTTPTTAKPPVSTQSPYRVETPLSHTGRSGISRGRGMGDRWEGPLSNSYEPDRRKRLLSEIRKPVKIKEAPTKYKMNFEGKYSAQNTPDKTASAQSDALVASGNAKGQRWRQSDKYWSGYETTERMNIIHDRVGHGKQAWDMIIDEAKEKNGWRTREMQEELNKIAHERAMLKENPDFDSPFTVAGIDISPTTQINKTNFDKVNKIKNMMADKKTEKIKSQIAPEYPSNAVPQPDEVTNLHPKLQSGENASAYYKRLDPISADSMPDAAYPQIDNLKNKAKKKVK